MAKIDRWAVTERGERPNIAPEEATGLIGQLQDQTRVAHGDFFYTARILKIEDEVVYTSSGNAYELGEVDPGYETNFPNARERLIQKFSIKKETR